MRTIPPGGSAQIERRCSSDWIRVQVENDVGVMVTHAPYAVEYEDPRADAPIGAITLTFRRGEGINSLAPLMTANPPIDVGRLMTLAIDAGDGSWTEVFRGYADRVAWPKKWGGDVTVEGRDLAGRVMDTFIEEDRAYGSEAGEALEDVIQAVGDDNLEDPLTVHVAAPTGAVVVSPPDYVPSDVATFEAMQHLAESIGYAIRMRYIDGTGWALSLFEPERAKTVPDRTFTGALYYDVSRMEQDNADIFNVVEVEYSDEDEVRQRVEVEDAASIARYGRRYMRINEASDSIIRDSTTATALANAALSDLSEPDATLEIQCAYFWPGEVGIDLYRFEANGVHFSSDQDLAAVAIKHRLALGERPESWITVRGKPSAGVLLWEKKARQPKVSEPTSIYQLRNLNVQHNADGTSTVTWELGARLSETWGAYQLVTAPETPAKWDTVRAAVLPVTSPLTITTPVESGGVQQLGLLRLEGRYTDAATGERLTGDAYEHTVFPKTSIPVIDDDTGELIDGAVSRAGIVAGGILAAEHLREGARRFVSTIVFTPSDNNTVTWTAGTITFKDGTAYSIDAGTTGDMAAPTFIYFSSPLSATVLQQTTDPLDLADDDSVLVCYARPIADTDQMAMAVPVWGPPVVNAEFISGVYLSAIQAVVNTLSAITADIGEVYTGIITNDALSPTRGIRLSDTDVLPGTVVDFLDLGATGTEEVLKVGGLSILANGDTLVEDPVEKVAKVSHFSFRPTIAGGYSSSSASTSLASGTTARSFGASAPLPAGATTSSIRITGALVTAGNVCTLDLVKVTAAGVISTLATATITSTTRQTIQANIIETIDGTAAYGLRVQLTDNSGTSNPPWFELAEVDYTSNNTRQTL